MGRLHNSSKIKKKSLSHGSAPSGSSQTKLLFTSVTTAEDEDTIHSPERQPAPPIEDQSDSYPDVDSDTSDHQDLPITSTVLQRMLDRLEASLSNNFKSLASSVQKEIKDLGQRTDSVERTTSSLQYEFQELKTYTKRLEDKLDSTMLKLSDLEDRSRRNNIRIRGIPERIVQGDLSTYIYDYFEALLGEDLNRESDIDRAHRLPKPRNLPPATARDTIVRIHFYSLKEKIIRRAANPPPLQTEFVALKLFTDLSAETLARRRSFSAVTTILRAQNIRYRWGFPTKLILERKGEQFIFHSPEIGNKTLSDWGLMTLPQNPPHAAPPDNSTWTLVDSRRTPRPSSAQNPTPPTPNNRPRRDPSLTSLPGKSPGKMPRFEGSHQPMRPSDPRREET